MIKLDDFFNRPTESMHPRLRNWKARLSESGVSATLEVYRPETEFGQSRPEMNIQFTRNGTLLPLETVPWDDDLNAGLIQLHVRAVNSTQEAIRFGLGLRAAFRKAEREFGDGYFNAILVELVKESDLIKHVEVAGVVQYATALNANHEGRNYTICREMIAGAMSGRAKELTELLGYSEEEAKHILVSSLACYLDERFTVSARRRSGLL